MGADRESGAAGAAGAAGAGSRGTWDSGDDGSVKCEGFVYIYTAASAVWGWSVGVGGNVRGLYFYRMGSVKCEGFV